MTATPVSPAHASALSRWGYAIADDTRARVLLALRGGEARPSDLAALLGVSRQVMSNQLACLRGCGLVEGRAEGRSTWYRLADERIGTALDGLLDLVVALRPDCCAPEGCTCR
ncbi:ArsR family transcriptional regulator [Citricoccus sp. SGAir0253]|uniref:ArsR/SmtB family transcription factor n=1 Tax=Citricoccus sp. SGAir0253 TaxID=2567881 RepID=UPI0010CD43AF|nr:metalloregulator ArsR/SmtB family transcription factor [Citricoccus sp. SGAir0253]QCU77526.1 ArsR family transcriptional regulator [Citricoccus sp. SGAir0253]